MMLIKLVATIIGLVVSFILNDILHQDLDKAKQKEQSLKWEIEHLKNDNDRYHRSIEWERKEKVKLEKLLKINSIEDLLYEDEEGNMHFDGDTWYDLSLYNKELADKIWKDWFENHKDVIYDF